MKGGKFVGVCESFRFAIYRCRLLINLSHKFLIAAVDDANSLYFISIIILELFGLINRHFAKIILYRERTMYRYVLNLSGPRNTLLLKKIFPIFEAFDRL